MIKFQKRYFIETVEINEISKGHKHMPHIYSSRFQKHYTTNQHFHVLKYSQNPSIIVMKITHIMQHNITFFLYSTENVLTLSRENRHPNLIIHM